MSINKQAFPHERLQAIAQMEETHFWFTGRRRIMHWLLQRHTDIPAETLADIGCGTGFNLPQWLPYARMVTGIDQWMSVTSLPCSGNPVHCIESSVCQLPLASASIDIAMCLDVLEHVPDTVTVSELLRIIRPGGKVFVSVPAMPWLWSLRDEQAGHLRRYTRSSLRSLFESAGFRIIYLNYYQCLLFPLVLATRLLLPASRANITAEEQPSAITNAVLNAITWLEFQCLKHLSLPWGSSLIMVAQKP